MNLGNFAFHKGRFVLLVDYQDTIIGTIWTVMDLDTKAISHVNEQDLTAYTYKPRNMKPASDMTEKQRDDITCIEQQLNLSFNGQTLADVSTFLGLFLEKAREHTISSKYSRYNGLRQDSINLDLSHAPNGGYDITTTESYDQPFQVESVNQNEQFIHGWNGYISSDYSYLTERDIRNSSAGAVLRTVWTLAIEDTETHQIFSKSLSDTIFMPSHEDKK